MVPSEVGEASFAAWSRLRSCTFLSHPHAIAKGTPPLIEGSVLHIYPPLLPSISHLTETWGHLLAISMISPPFANVLLCFISRYQTGNTALRALSRSSFARSYPYRKASSNLSDPVCIGAQVLSLSIACRLSSYVLEGKSVVRLPGERRHDICKIMMCNSKMPYTFSNWY